MVSAVMFWPYTCGVGVGVTGSKLVQDTDYPDCCLNVFL